MTEVLIAGESLVLLPERALWWPARATLMVADAHIGKGTAFRALGVPVPAGSSDDTLARLAGLLERHAPRRLIFLGDLIHARSAREPGLMQRFAALRRDGCDWLLVRGNHDAHAGVPPELALTVVDEPWADGPFALCHHPAPQPGRYVLAGHVHPAVRIEAGGDRLRLPCFAFGEAVGLLPAFGQFTGHADQTPAPGLRLYACAGERVLAVPHSSARRRSRA